MKKIITGILALALAATLGITALAANTNINNNGGYQDIDVNAKYVDNTTTATVYSVDITWEAMEFTYSVSGSKAWNPAKHDYDITSASAWTSATNNEIKVVNHSNAPIEAKFEFAAEAGYTAIGGNFTSAKLDLPSAEGKMLNDATLVGTTALALSGELDQSVAALTKVGTVTVTVTGR